ncbi:MAG TPA: hypothetical protein VGO97_00425 [Solirubrobacterales bacterium]|nr:hypothetical protein [Solirubrobacterales bacterium]
MKLIHTTRGSTFLMCQLHKVDDRFPKYPRMPVVSCPGYRRAGAETAEGDGGDAASVD